MVNLRQLQTDMIGLLGLAYGTAFSSGVEELFESNVLIILQFMIMIMIRGISFLFSLLFIANFSVSHTIRQNPNSQTPLSSSLVLQSSQITIENFQIPHNVKNEYVEFKEIIDSFTELKENIKPLRFAQLSQKLNCQKGFFVKIAVVNHKIYIQIEKRSLKKLTKQKEKMIKNLVSNLEKIKNYLLNLYFIVNFEDGLGGENKQQIQHGDPCYEIPMFMFEKNIKSLYERNKFLLPLPLLFEDWEKQINLISEYYKFTKQGETNTNCILSAQQQQLIFKQKKWSPFEFTKHYLLSVFQGCSSSWSSHKLNWISNFSPFFTTFSNPQPSQFSKFVSFFLPSYKFESSSPLILAKMQTILNFTLQSLLLYSSYQNLTSTLNQSHQHELENGTDLNRIFQKIKEQQKQKKIKQAQYLVTFEQTIQKFPFLKQNMKMENIHSFLQQGACGEYHPLTEFLIIDGEVYIFRQFVQHDRTQTIKKIFENIGNKIPLPDAYFVMYLDDLLNLVPKDNHEICRQLPMFLFNKNTESYLQQTKFLFPDPYFLFNSKNQVDYFLETRSKNTRWEDRQKKAFFSGIPSSPYFGKIPINSTTNFYRYYHRGALIELAHQRPDIIQARLIQKVLYFIEGPLLEELQRRLNQSNLIQQRVDNIEYLQKYRYHIVLDGFGAPWGRIPQVLLSQSVMMKPNSNRKLWFYNKLIPDFHYVYLQDDLSDLIEKIEEMNKDDSKVKQIIQNGLKFADQNFKDQPVNNFMIETLFKYAAIQKLQFPKPAKQLIKKGVPLAQVMQRIKKKQFVETNTSIKQNKQINKLSNQKEFFNLQKQINFRK